ncbi:hypothetical protein ACFOEE_14760 [Pseudoalteromonas fenneropenaei]|uniref:Uncharacterized protein n=1 Tax=Pseudoalteromonas fenneropenaei TaxID=1737459 RepID=A0ABV7CMN2_9GAMM
MADYQGLLKQFAAWLQDVNEHEVKQLIVKFIAYQQALQQLSEDKLQLYSDYLKRDFAHFKQHHQEYNEIALQELRDTIWYELAQLEDRTQLEWQALQGDFQHQGKYKAGEAIALGQLVCKNCGHCHDVYYAQAILPCNECGGEEFIRKALHP